MNIIFQRAVNTRANEPVATRPEDPPRTLDAGEPDCVSAGGAKAGIASGQNRQGQAAEL